MIRNECIGHNLKKIYSIFIDTYFLTMFFGILNPLSVVLIYLYVAYLILVSVAQSI